MESIDWLTDVYERAPLFLQRMRGSSVPGFFRYSLTGDLFKESSDWGLGNTVFSVKALHVLGTLQKMSSFERDELREGIVRFERPDGTCSDPLIAKKAFWREKLAGLKHRQFQNLFHQETVRAETRQARSALLLLGETSVPEPKNLPRTPEAVLPYLQRLDWSKPWHAGSHFSHLLFFLKHAKGSNADLIQTALAFLASLRQRDGGWYQGSPSLQQRINGAMKVLTGLQAADQLTIDSPTQLVDLALTAGADKQACDNFNVLYVLAKASAQTGHTYRMSDIRSFALDRLSIFRSYYWPEHGGFSFFSGRANHRYYHARITRGLPEPDIHGTVLFLWGLSLLPPILDIDIPFTEFVT